MTGLFSKIWFPAVVVGALTLQMGASYKDEDPIGMVEAYWSAPETSQSCFADTVKYPRAGYRRYWTAEEQAGTISIDDSLLALSGISIFGEETDTVIKIRPVALDTLVAPDSLLQIDTFRYRYYAALIDSLCHVWVRDSLISARDTLGYTKLDSIYYADSASRAVAAYWAWYATLDRKGRKKADMERMLPIKQARMDSIKAVKEAKQERRDSIIENTPRILESYVFKDSLSHLRIIKWEHERDFHKITVLPEDTSYNYRFYDYPFQRKDVNATWLGVAGSPVQYYDFSKRDSQEGVGFYEVQESWSYNPSNLPMYNTKTPYTELSYFGTLLASSSKESDNLHLLTTQNITPALNVCMFYDRFGGGGILNRENTINKTGVVSANYLGKKYTAHGGYIYNMVSRQENGGVSDLRMVRDTTIDVREAAVRLNNASSVIKKNTFFLDQQYRVPLYFVENLIHRKGASDSSGLASSGTLPEAGEAPADTLASDDDITTFFVGHSSEYSVYSRVYQDQGVGSFYGGTSYYNPNTTFDSLRVMKFENRIFARLQPWAEDGAISKLDVGLGHRMMSYYSFDPTLIYKPSNHHWNATYLYAGAEGKLFRVFSWDATGKYVFLGDEFSDFDLAANAVLSFYPFRKAKNSPLTIGAHFKTSLDEPEYYAQHLLTNHYKWDNDFGKISSTRIKGDISIPYWHIYADVSYNLLANNVFYGTDGIIQQNATAMSIFTASLKHNLALGPFHADHHLLVQLSSKPEIVPLPLFAANGRYYLQFTVGKAKAMEMQVGANILYNTEWYAPAWNPALGVFYNQEDNTYGNAPYVDAFINMQWKRACIFIKYENANMGWPLDQKDYFSADRYIRTTRVLKLGIYWPFYTQPAKDRPGAQNPPEGMRN